MKRNIVKIVLILSVLGIIFGIILSNKNGNSLENDESYLRKEVTGVVSNLKIKDFLIEKIGVYYYLTAELEKNDESEFSCRDYSIYLLDDNNNLIYLIDGEKIGNFSDVSDIIKINIQINYEISSVKKIEIVKKEYGYTFNRDLRNETKKIDGPDSKGYYHYYE